MRCQYQWLYGLILTLLEPMKSLHWSHIYRYAYNQLIIVNNVNRRCILLLLINLFSASTNKIWLFLQKSVCNSIYVFCYIKGTKLSKRVYVFNRYLDIIYITWLTILFHPFLSIAVWHTSSQLVFNEFKSRFMVDIQHVERWFLSRFFESLLAHIARAFWYFHLPVLLLSQISSDVCFCETKCSDFFYTSKNLVFRKIFFSF